MRLLFAISVASFSAVLWLALALARHIRRDRRVVTEPVTHAPAMEFFEAGEYRTPREMKHNQQLPQHGRRRIAADLNDRPEPAALLPRPASNVIAFRTKDQSAPALLPLVSGAGLEAVVIDSTLQFVMPERQGQQESSGHDTVPREFSSERKSPQSARSGSFRRFDLSQYNQDLGDLTDPYTHSPRTSGMRPAAKNR